MHRAVCAMQAMQALANSALVRGWCVRSGVCGCPPPCCGVETSTTRAVRTRTTTGPERLSLVCGCSGRQSSRPQVSTLLSTYVDVRAADVEEALLAPGAPEVRLANARLKPACLTAILGTT